MTRLNSDITFTEDSQDLAAMISFKANHRYWCPYDEDETTGEKPVLMSAGATNVFVYCDLLEHVMVGDVKAPLFCIVRRKTNMKMLRQYAGAEKELQYDRHPVDRLWRTITIHRRQGVCGIGVSWDSAPLSFTIKGCSPFRHSTLLLC